MPPPGMGSAATAQHIASTAMGPEARQSAQPHCRDAFIPSAPLPRTGGEQVGLPGWWKPARDHLLPASLRADAACVLVLQASCCPRGCLPAVFVKSRGAQVLAFASLGICVMSQGPP